MRLLSHVMGIASYTPHVQIDYSLHVLCIHYVHRIIIFLWPTEPKVMNLTIQTLQQDDNGVDSIINLHWRESAYQNIFRYSVNIFPNQTHCQVLLSSNSTCIKLRMRYDTLYNVSMVAAPRCGHPQNSTPLNIGLLYRKN